MRVTMKYVFDVPDMSCDHCRMRIEKAFSASGIAKAWTVDLKSKTVAIESGASKDSLAAILKDAGYPPKGF
jgi:copper chaperone